MALLLHVVEIAIRRKMYVYAFYRLCKLHNVSNGTREDFDRVAMVLRENRDFRSGVFRLAASVLSGEPGLSVEDLVVILALAVGGPGVAGDDQLEAPDELVDMFRSVLLPEKSEPAGEPVAEYRDSGERAYGALPGENGVIPQGSAAPAPERVFAQDRVRTPEVEPALPVAAASLPEFVGRPQAVAPVQEETARPAEAAGPEVVATVARLESERELLEQRMRQMEQRLSDVLQEVESLSGPGRMEQVGATPGERVQPGPGIPVPVGHQEPVLAHRGAAERAFAGVSEDSQRGHFEEWEGGEQRPSPEGSRAAWPGSWVHDGDRGEHGDEVSPRLVAAEPGAFGWPPLMLAILVLAVLALVGAAAFLGRELVVRHAGVATVAPGTVAGSDVEGAPVAKPAAGTPAVGAGSAPYGTGKTQAEGEITRMLAGWAAAAAANDPVSESRFYAPHLDRYFLKRDVSRAYVLGDKQAYRERGNRIQRFTVGSFRFEFPTATSALVTLTKTWAVDGPDQSGITHTTRSRVWLVRSPDGWKITGEQDLRGE